MYLVHLAGVQRAGKTTVFLACRKAYGALYSRKSIEMIDGTLFIGTGPRRWFKKRCVGADEISMERIELKDVGLQLAYDHPGDQPALVDSLQPMADRRIPKRLGFRSVALFSWVTPEKLLSHGTKAKDIDRRMGIQDELYARFMVDYDRVIRWENESLDDRIKQTLDLIRPKGVSNATK